MPQLLVLIVYAVGRGVKDVDFVKGFMNVSEKGEGASFLTS